jgi:hypothetical protein
MRDQQAAADRDRGNGQPRALIAADIQKTENGRLAEHRGVLQDGTSATESKSGLPMFGDRFPS